MPHSHVIFIQSLFILAFAITFYMLLKKPVVNGINQLNHNSKNKSNKNNNNINFKIKNKPKGLIIREKTVLSKIKYL